MPWSVVLSNQPWTLELIPQKVEEKSVGERLREDKNIPNEALEELGRLISVNTMDESAVVFENGPNAPPTFKGNPTECAYWNFAGPYLLIGVGLRDSAKVGVMLQDQRATRSCSLQRASSCPGPCRVEGLSGLRQGRGGNCFTKMRLGGVPDQSRAKNERRQERKRSTSIVWSRPSPRARCGPSRWPTKILIDYRKIGVRQHQK